MSTARTGSYTMAIPAVARPANIFVQSPDTSSLIRTAHAPRAQTEYAQTQRWEFIQPRRPRQNWSVQRRLFCDDVIARMTADVRVRYCMRLYRTRHGRGDGPWG